MIFCGWNERQTLSTSARQKQSITHKVIFDLVLVKSGSIFIKIATGAVLKQKNYFKVFKCIQLSCIEEPHIYTELNFNTLFIEGYI